MTIWETCIAIYGLVISPISGFYLVKWRLKDGLKTGIDLLVYLLIGFLNMGITVFTMAILPEDSWLIFWAYLILFIYIVSYGVHPLTIEAKK